MVPLGKKLRAIGVSALMSCLVAWFAPMFLATAHSAQNEALNKKQGSGIRIVLDRSFIDEYADKTSIETDFVVHRVSKIHPAEADGEVHISGVAEKAKLPTVAELTNPMRKDFDKFTKLAKKDDEADRTVKLKGVWRIWCEHPGTLNQVQGSKLPDRFPNSNPDHVFEVHPIWDVDGRSLLSTFKPIDGYKAKEAERAILAYENVPCRIRKSGSKVSIDSKGVGFNFVDLIVDPDEERPAQEVADGRLVLCQLRDLEGELIARRRRVVFVAGTDPFDKSKSIGSGRLRLICLPRISLKLVQWRLDNSTDASDPDDPLNWDLPYELVAIGLVQEMPGEDID